jgi:hypothetical protein
MKTAAIDDLSVVGRLTQCVNTQTGWRGVDETGAVIEVRRRSGVEGVAVSPATIPEAHCEV